MPQCTGKASIYTPIYEQLLTKDPNRKAIKGGYEYTYTGVAIVDPKEQMASVERLSKCRKPVADSARIVPTNVKHVKGNTHSYQWNAGGKECHGFEW